LHARAGTAAIRRSSAQAERETDVQSNGHRGSGSRPGFGTWLTPEQQAAARERAIAWREEWRAEAAGRKTKKLEQPNPAPRPRKGESGQAAFAAGIARAEFGRFYWDEKKHRLAATGRKPRPAK
jgi:hypothetical protein